MLREFHFSQIEVVDDKMAAVFRAMTPQQRLAVAFDAHEFAWKLCLKRERERTPDASADQILRAAWKRMGYELR